MRIAKITFIASVLFISLFGAGCTTNYNDPIIQTIHSDTYYRTVHRHQWEPAERLGQWFIRLNVPNITRTVIDNGAVLVYFKNSLNNWVALPYSTTVYTLGQQFTEEIWAGYALGTVDIDYIYTNPADMTPPPTLELRILVIRL